jgi:hypothetical protein
MARKARDDRKDPSETTSAKRLRKQIRGAEKDLATAERKRDRAQARVGALSIIVDELRAALAAREEPPTAPAAPVIPEPPAPSPSSANRARRAATVGPAGASTRRAAATRSGASPTRRAASSPAQRRPTTRRAPKPPEPPAA